MGDGGGEGGGKEGGGEGFTFGSLLVRLGGICIKVCLSVYRSFNFFLFFFD